ncbi:MAG: hypothetical protein HY822_01840 [Acidobacteria bacterium]|nr:hypothetical protein [Acidobacteriota bacterium]
MRRLLPLALFALVSAGAQTRIPVVAAPVARAAAGELRAHLARLYPDCSFPLATAAPRRGRAILLTTRRQAAPESFTIAATGERATITGDGARGLLYGVCALLEKLGFGFHLSYETAPPPRRGEPRFEEWEMADAPLFPDRLVFNWHNFLSSGSAWEFEDWQRWIDGAARMRYNAVMVHAYGNNPMFQFSHHGQTKEVGYLATTAKGRDWGTQHVNDVRRLIGGELFRGPVFGASVALAGESQRSVAATRLMQQVFAYARGRSLGVTFALDVDTESANPQNILRTLPAGALIASGKFVLANPDTPEGYAYYKAQTRQLLATYPQIGRLAVWFRNNRTPWRDVAPEQFPPAWRDEFRKALAANPALAGDKEAHGMFAMSRVVVAFQRALKELKRTDVELSYGSWRLHWLAASDAFMPHGVKVIPLDWETIFETDKAQAIFRGIVNRPAIPIVWAHHDDRTYIGRPYTPYKDFAKLLASSRSASGFGIIHWTTRPLDLYFKSLAGQVWKASANESLETACRRMAADDAGGRYLLEWITGAPMFGRETSNRFIDVPLKDAPAVIAAARKRLELLKTVQSGDPEWLAYYRDFEEFVIEFFSSHAAWERAQDLYQQGDIARARQALAGAKPEEAIRRYVRMSSHGRISRGEVALVVSLNLRWRPYFVSLRQALGMEPVRVKFQPTQHEPLAQGAGSNTFYIDPAGHFWGALGEKETGIPAMAFDSTDELCRSGLRIDKPVTLRIRPILGDRLAPGPYRVALRTAYGKVEAARTAEVTNGALDLAVRPEGAAGLCAVTLESARN